MRLNCCIAFREIKWLRVAAMPPEQTLNPSNHPDGVANAVRICLDFQGLPHCVALLERSGLSVFGGSHRPPKKRGFQTGRCEFGKPGRLSVRGTVHVHFHWRVLLPCNKSNRCCALHPRMAWICEGGKVSRNSFANYRCTLWLVLTRGTPGMDACRRKICTGTLGNRRLNARVLLDAASPMKIRESLPPDLSSRLASATPFLIIGRDHTLSLIADKP